jgi:putative ABC transport system substrate-binding protein
MKTRRSAAAVAGLLVALMTLAAAESAEPVLRMPAVGILNYAAAGDIRVVQFRDALRELGYVEGRNLTLVQLHAEGVLDRLPTLAADLVASRVDVIIALGPATWAAKQATSTVPIITAFSGDPVGQGVVASLDRPGGNITGFSYMSTELAEKRLEFLCSAFPKCNRIAILYNPQEPATTREMEHTEAAARTLGVALQPLAVRQVSELEEAFAAATRDRAEGILSFTHGFAVLNQVRIIELAARHRVPTMYGWREFADAGGLMSYGPDIDVLVRQAAGYVDRILKGAKPNDLPIQQPSRFQLVVNLKTAKALGLDVPATLLARADEVIE